MNAVAKLLSSLMGKPAFDADFKESDHPRGKDGKFGSGGGGKAASKGASDDFGEAFTAYSGKPKEAIEHLLKEKRGYVPAAFKKDGLGDIDLPYGKGGKNGFGLVHIIERRNQDGMNGNAFIRELPQIINGGEVISDPRFSDRKYVVNNKKRAVIRLDLDGKKRNWLVTAYADTKSPGAMDGLRTTVAHAYDDKRYLPLPHSGEVNKNIGPSRPRVNGDRIAFDAASRRHFDENGFLHVSLCHISKEQVAEYYGSEIPGWREQGLDPNRVYKGYRPAAELANGAATFNGLPLLKEHVKDSAEDPQKDLRIGNLGTDAVFHAPYLDNSLIIQDAAAIAALAPKDGGAPKRELSASYRYDPVFTPGVWRGERYDFIMTNIRGNHVAVVEEGRAGPDVVVSDANPITRRGTTMDPKALLEQLLAALGAKTPPAEKGGAQDPASGNPATDEGGEDPTEKPAEESRSEASAEDEDDFEQRLSAHVSGMEDKELAAKLAEIIEAVKAAGLSGDEDPEATAEDEDESAEKEKGKPAMDKRPGKRGAGKSRVTPAATNINIAMDAKAVAAQLISGVRAGLRAQIEAAREVRPLVGDLDPMAFDSAAGIYQKALGLIGKPTKVTDVRALRELCALARETKRGAYPVVAAALANDSRGEADPAFASLAKIRKA